MRRAVGERGGAARRTYPQVDPGAGGVCDASVLVLPAGVTVAQALALARRRQAGVVAAGEGAWVLREDLARASLLGLEALSARALARPLPAVDVSSSEVAVRRHLAEGVPAVIVRDRRGPVGAVTARTAGPRALVPLGAGFARGLSPRTHDLLTVVGRVAGERGMRAFLVGGLVRDVLRGAPADPRDLDVVVEGDGPALARAVAAALGAPGSAVVEHERFGTASIGLPDARIDVATARSERYERPGALPRVMPASIAQDLGRRDFTVNAMAVEIGSGEYGLLDPLGGRCDLRRRRLRVLHPLSFVEDPTRIFRAARYAARLGFRLDRWTARAQALALGLGAYPALSGQRLAAELDLVLADARPGAALRRLGASGALRLLDPRYRYTRATGARVARLGAALTWAQAHGVRVAPLELGLAALLADQPREVLAGALERLGIVGEPRARIERALTPLPGPLGAGTPSERARRLRGLDDLGLAWRWLEGVEREVLDWYVAGARSVRPALRGEDVLALGVPPGPAVARVLEELRDARLDGRVADRDAEAAHVRHWIERHKEG